MQIHVATACELVRLAYLAKRAAFLTQWTWHASVLLINGLAKPWDRASGILSEASLKSRQICSNQSFKHITTALHTHTYYFNLDLCSCILCVASDFI